MPYRIAPKNEFNISERMTYRKDNKEIHCGFLWKTGAFITNQSPDLLDAYEEDIGLSVSSHDFSEVNLSDEGKKLIYFSPTTSQDEQKVMTEIFEHSKTIDDFDIGFQHKGWQLVDADIVMWGELSITNQEQIE
jgi:hypothetical protein